MPLENAKNDKISRHQMLRNRDKMPHVNAETHTWTQGYVRRTSDVRQDP